MRKPLDKVPKSRYSSRKMEPKSLLELFIEEVWAAEAENDKQECLEFIQENEDLIIMELLVEFPDFDARTIASVWRRGVELWVNTVWAEKER